MAVRDHGKVSGFSGNEIYCLNKLGYRAGELCLGNHVIALGIGRGIGAGLSTLAGGEISEITNLVQQGRSRAYNRMVKEAQHYGGLGLAGVSFDMVNHVGNVEFIAVGSTVKQEGGDTALKFTTADDAQSLYCQMDAGFEPKRFVFGNVAYSIGVGGSIMGAIKGLARGEVAEYTEIFDTTRHLALTRIKNEARQVGANSVVGIKTSIMPLMGAQEMMMLGTASNHPYLAAYAENPVTSGLTNQEMWNLVNIGYMPVSLVMGVSVYSLGLIGGIGSVLKSLAGGNVDTLTELLYEAREKALERVHRDAEKCGADEVVGVKTYIYELGGGLVEFMAIGTAVKKVEGLTTHTPDLMPQAIIRERDTFVDVTLGAGRGTDVEASQKSSARSTQGGPIALIMMVGMAVFYVLMAVLG